MSRAVHGLHSVTTQLRGSSIVELASIALYSEMRFGPVIITLAVVAACSGSKSRSSPGAAPDDTAWVRLPSSREPSCTDSTWICAKWKDEEWQPRSVYVTGKVIFVTLRLVDGSGMERIEVSCPTAAYRIVWMADGAFDTVSLPTWAPMTANWERSLWNGLCAPKHANSG